MSSAETSGDTRDALYADAAAAHGGMIARLCAGYEADPALREDLEQEIHLQLWRSFAGFAKQCSLATWVHRIAHNVGARHIHRAVRAKPAAFVDLDTVDVADSRAGPEDSADAALTLERLYALIWRLRPIDRQVLLLHLEGLDAAASAEITGLTPGAVGVRIHRIKALLAETFAKGNRA
ncbi:RNA polymerase sigma factor [Sphingosinicella soli]|uniref:RNA polymerase sigma-70 factor (ECF subfamily) n=1 Tax=Sphingosinicella soli TaxID=333708 RepID=A0A7W7AZG8_9SPHN|nr:sigma-70 family RNA polymerase sigma factor [Sphingosinicella soli]MBB4631224.1 RNA polymerase sigma-70 factor (ECF subfamily) [Sphingosinicella soli]